MNILIHKGTLLLSLALLVSCTHTPKPDSGGSITHHQDESSLRYYNLSSLKIEEGAIGLILPVVTTRRDQTVRVLQPANPAGVASLKTDIVTASIPPSRGGPLPATPADRAIGGMVWLGAVLLLGGAAGGGLRFLPFAFGRLVPIGISLLIGSTGAVMIAYAIVLDQAPWQVTGLAVTIAVAAAVWVAWRDNRKKTQAADGTTRVDGATGADVAREILHG